MRRPYDENLLTALSGLGNRVLDGALVGCGERLRVDALAGGAEAAAVHGSLQSIVLPSKNVIRVLAVARAGSVSDTRSEQKVSLGPILLVSGAEVEGLRAVLGPNRLVVVRARIPDDLCIIALMISSRHISELNTVAHLKH